MKSKKVCIICGDEFDAIGKHPATKTCSQDCRARLASLRQRQANKRWRTSPGGREYAKRYDDKKINNRRQRRPLRICVVCGSEHRRRGGGSTCSLKCTVKQAEARKRTQHIASQERRELRQHQPKSETRLTKRMLQEAALRALREIGISVPLQEEE